MRLGRAPVTSQLSRLALAGRTGVLRIPGNHTGTIRLYQGMVTHVESSGTPGLDSRLARWSTTPDAGTPGALTRAWVLREAICDAALAMLTGAPRSGRFTAGDTPGPDGDAAMTVAEMLTEVNRRLEVIRQLPAAAPADTVVVRNPRLSARGVHVSASQWALLVRMNEATTPRQLAIGCGTSVFTTTLQVFRLITMDLVTTAGGPPPDQRTVSFIRATASWAAAPGTATAHATRGIGQ
ncbi:MAG TPA: hypothetical protein VFO01_15740 [Trebonia sp.]|nr:hypothetical protein [Trebonia sp.]